MAKCDLGKVNLKVMLVSSFPNYKRGGLMPLAGAPCGLYAVACSQFFAKCYHNSLLFATSWCFGWQGCHGDLLLMLEHCPAPSTL